MCHIFWPRSHESGSWRLIWWPENTWPQLTWLAPRDSWYSMSCRHWEVGLRPNWPPLAGPCCRACWALSKYFGQTGAFPDGNWSKSALVVLEWKSTNLSRKYGSLPKQGPWTSGAFLFQTSVPPNSIDHVEVHEVGPQLFTRLPVSCRSIWQGVRANNATAERIDRTRHPFLLQSMSLCSLFAQFTSQDLRHTQDMPHWPEDHRRSKCNPRKFKTDQWKTTSRQKLEKKTDFLTSPITPIIT